MSSACTSVLVQYYMKTFLCGILTRKIRKRSQKMVFVIRGFVSTSFSFLIPGHGGDNVYKGAKDHDCKTAQNECSKVPRCWVLY